METRTADWYLVPVPGSRAMIVLVPIADSDEPKKKARQKGIKNQSI